jgi:hypothetical protein
LLASDPNIFTSQPRSPAAGVVLDLYIEVGERLHRQLLRQLGSHSEGTADLGRLIANEFRLKVSETETSPNRELLDDVVEDLVRKFEAVSLRERYSGEAWYNQPENRRLSGAPGEKGVYSEPQGAAIFDE